MQHSIGGDWQRGRALQVDSLGNQGNQLLGVPDCMKKPQGALSVNWLSATFVKTHAGKNHSALPSVTCLRLQSEPSQQMPQMSSERSVTSPTPSSPILPPRAVIVSATRASHTLGCTPDRKKINFRFGILCLVMLASNCQNRKAIRRGSSSPG